MCGCDAAPLGEAPARMSGGAFGPGRGVDGFELSTHVRGRRPNLLGQRCSQAGVSRMSGGAFGPGRGVDGFELSTHVRGRFAGAFTHVRGRFHACPGALLAPHL
jgi:hypothetical protein